jgi:hypothetical protein
VGCVNTIPLQTGHFRTADDFTHPTGSNTLSLPCLVAGQDRALDGGNGCVCVLEPIAAAAQNTAILCLGASKISLQIRTTEFTNPTGRCGLAV